MTKPKFVAKKGHVQKSTKVIQKTGTNKVITKQAAKNLSTAITGGLLNDNSVIRVKSSRFSAIRLENHHRSNMSLLFQHECHGHLLCKLCGNCMPGKCKGTDKCNICGM